mgnify:CR=1 FL=1
MIIDQPKLGDRIADENGFILPEFALFIEGLVEKVNGLYLDQYTVAEVPDATQYEGAIIFVTDEVGGATPAFSDGTNWRRTADRFTITT